MKMKLILHVCTIEPHRYFQAVMAHLSSLLAQKSGMGFKLIQVYKEKQLINEGIQLFL